MKIPRSFTLEKKKNTNTTQKQDERTKKVGSNNVCLVEKDIKRNSDSSSSPVPLLPPFNGAMVLFIGEKSGEHWQPSIGRWHVQTGPTPRRTGCCRATVDLLRLSTDMYILLYMQASTGRLGAHRVYLGGLQ